MATPVTLVSKGTPITATNGATPVTIVGDGGVPVAPLVVGDTFETDDGGTVEIVTIENGVVTSATYTAP